MIKSFSGQVVFCFAILRAISAYVGENWLSQYTFSFINENSQHIVKNTEIVRKWVNVKIRQILKEVKGKIGIK